MIRPPQTYTSPLTGRIVAVEIVYSDPYRYVRILHETGLVSDISKVWYFAGEYTMQEAKEL